MARKRKNRIFAMSAAPSATPPKPNRAAISEITKNNKAHLTSDMAFSSGPDFRRTTSARPAGSDYRKTDAGGRDASPDWRWASARPASGARSARPERPDGLTVTPRLLHSASPTGRH